MYPYNKFECIDILDSFLISMARGYKLIYIFISGCDNTIFQWDNFGCDKFYCNEKTIDVIMVIDTYRLQMQYCFLPRNDYHYN
jgi:hypothetical protein